MSALEHFPHINQLSSPTTDGQPDENAKFNCVPTSICAGLRYLTGDQSFQPDQLKDAAYGQTYAGFTAAYRYVDFCAQHGVSLYPCNDSSPSELVKLAHKHLALGHPVIFTEPDPYEPPGADWWHVCVFYAESQGSLTAMDPIGGQSITQSDAQWAHLLQANQIWIMEGTTMTIDLDNPVVAGYFTPAGDKHWRCKQTGFIVHDGILKFYRSFGNNALCGLTHLGLPKSNEQYPHPEHPTIAEQEFERAWVRYDPEHKLDQPPSAGDAYLMHLPNS
jgi:hypothetical protein